MGEWISVSSSNIDAVQYDDETRTMTVRFLNGSEYTYSDVPPSEAAALVSSPSPGRYFLHFIKGAYEQA